MATKTLGNTGADYASWADWIVYLKTLGTLSATETGRVLTGEFNGGDCQLTGAGITPTSSNRLVIECNTGAKFTGNPLRYGDGARVLFDGANEQVYVNWDYVTIQDLAFKRSGTGGHTSGDGAIAIAGGKIADLYDIVLEVTSATLAKGLDDRAIASSAARENVTVVIDGVANAIGISCRNANKSYLNCAAHAFGSPTGTTGLHQAYCTATWINCETLGFATDVTASYGAGSKNCATSKASGASNMASMTGAQFSVVGATEHVAWGTYGSHDLRVKSTSTIIKDAGAASGGTTLDIIGQSVSGGTRDIGPYEYQAAASGPAPFKIKSVDGGGMQNLGGMRAR